jgi:hypothetical protein
MRAKKKAVPEAPPMDRQAGHARELEEEERSSGPMCSERLPGGGRRSDRQDA